MKNDLPTLRKFVAPEIIFGNGARHTVGNFARNFGAQKVLIVSDPGVVKAGWVTDIENSLQEVGIAYSLYTNVSPNPRAEEVMEGAHQYNDTGCNVIVAVGGGSPMDCAKGIGIVSTNRRHILDFEGVDQIMAPIPPLIFVPTTAGTSADVSQFAIISDQHSRMKISIISKALVPDVSLIDPETTLSMEPFLTACTGIDAMVHAIEAFVSTASGPLTDVHALEAIKLVSDNLPALVANPNDVKLREQLMLASLKAGLAFSNAILGAVHAMSHSLGGYLDLPHGLCNSILVERVIDYNFDHAQDRFKVIAETLGIDTRGMSHQLIRNRLTDNVRQLKLSVGLTHTLGEAGVSLSDIPSLSGKALTDPCILTNPRKSNKRDVEVVYEEAL